VSVEYFLTLILEKYGMEIKDIDETRMEFSLQLVAFKNGAIDGASGARRAGHLQQGSSDRRDDREADRSQSRS